MMLTAQHGEFCTISDRVVQIKILDRRDTEASYGHGDMLALRETDRVAMEKLFFSLGL